MTTHHTSGAADLPEALRVPLDSLHADACLFALSESEVACGKKPGFMAENNGWKPHPIYTTPQPTQPKE